MSEVVTTNRSQAQIMESVLADGDLSKLSTEQRVAYYFQVCESLGLNPYTRPFDYITLNGKRVLYAKRDCADQLRAIRGITLTVTDKRLEDGLFVVTVRATDAKGRSDEDFGAVPMDNLKGEARANAMLKAITKAKRRVTLSICGMGINDESEVEGLAGAIIEGVELPPPPRERAAAASTPRAPRRAEPAAPATPVDPLDLPLGHEWLVALKKALGDTESTADVTTIGGHASVNDALSRDDTPPKVKRQITELLADAYAKHAEATTDAADPDAADEPELPPVEIAGSRYASA